MDPAGLVEADELVEVAALDQFLLQREMHVALGMRECRWSELAGERTRFAGGVRVLVTE